MLKIVKITDFMDMELDVYARISEIQLLNRADPFKGIFIAESPKVIERALDSGCIPLSFLIEEKEIEGEAKGILEKTENMICQGLFDGVQDISVFTATHEVLRNLTGFPMTRGALCAMRRPIQKTPEEICCGCNRVAVLQNVVNPTNVGAIFRSAAALNMEAVLLTYDCTDPLYRRSIRVSMGTVFQIPWTYLPKSETGNYLQKLGFKTVAMALKEDSFAVNDPALKQEEKLAVILGAEGDGLPEETINQCDYTVMIPMSNGVDSLNVAAASAVAFWELSTRL